MPAATAKTTAAAAAGRSRRLLPRRRLVGVVVCAVARFSWATSVVAAPAAQAGGGGGGGGDTEALAAAEAASEARGDACDARSDDDPKPSCVDLDGTEQCREWARGGECQRNPRYMTERCAASCDSCASVGSPPDGGSVGVDPRLLELAQERVVLKLEGYEDRHPALVLGFYPNLAPTTVQHVLELFRHDCYVGNRVFRVERGFVAQISAVHPSNNEYQNSGKPLSAKCLELAAKTVPAEFSKVPHRRGALSMARYDDVNSGTSSFSMILSDWAANLDGQYAVFGRVLEGDDSILKQIERVETTVDEYNFVVPKRRIAILETTVITVDNDDDIHQGQTTTTATTTASDEL